MLIRLLALLAFSVVTLAENAIAPHEADAMPPVGCPEGYVMNDNGICVPDSPDDPYTGCVTLSGYNVPCTSPRWGEWSNDLSCYLKLVEPQPEYDNPIWQGRTTGAIYWCTVMTTGSVMGEEDDRFMVWLADGPGPDPEDLARDVFEEMEILPVAIGVAPRPGTGSAGLVGLPNWTWVDDPSPNTWGPLTASGTAGGITVTVTAQVEEVQWDMGDGTAHTCSTPGTPYKESYGIKHSPDCGGKHSYGEEGNYAITATSTWSATWEASTGASGTFDVDPVSSSVDIAIRELQVVGQ